MSAYIKREHIHNLDVFEGMTSTEETLTLSCHAITMEFTYPELVTILKYFEYAESSPLILRMIHALGFYRYNGTLFWSEDPMEGEEDE